MKKTSMNFADNQAAELSEHATHLGIGFAEIVRRALDEWLAAKRERRPMTSAVTAAKTAYVRLVRDDRELSFRNADVDEEPGYPDNERLYVRRGDRTLGSFDRDEVRYWFVEEAEDV